MVRVLSHITVSKTSIYQDLNQTLLVQRSDKTLMFILQETEPWKLKNIFLHAFDATQQEQGTHSNSGR